jgi:phage host-nuclease inhibitor protein Gam
MNMSGTETSPLATSVVVGPLESAEDFNRVGLDFANNEREVLQLESKMNAEIAKVKAKYEAKLKARYDQRTSLTGMIAQFAKAVWNGKSVKQAFDYVLVNWQIPRGSLTFKDEEATILALKKIGRSDLIRTREEVKKDEFKEVFAADPKMLEALGAVVERPQASVKSVEVNWQTVALTSGLVKKSATAAQ